MNHNQACKEALANYVSRLISLGHRTDGKDRKARSEARACLARLRRGLGKLPGEVPESLQEVLPHLCASASDSEYTQAREICFLVGSLFALHPRHSGEHRNLGATMRALGTDNPSAEQRFINLLAARGAQLPDLLRQVVSLAESEDIPIDYYQLAEDLLLWNDEQRRVQLEWAREYWPPLTPASVPDRSDTPAGAGA